MSNVISLNRNKPEQLTLNYSSGKSTTPARTHGQPNPIAEAHFRRRVAVGKLPTDYTVSKQPIYVGATLDMAQLAGNYMGLVRNDTQATLGIVGPNYGLIQNGEIFDRLEAQMLRSFTDEQLKDIKIDDAVAYNGAQAYREYRLPKVSAKLFDYTDREVAFRIIACNGFAKGAVRMWFGAIDAFCINGMVMGEYLRTYRRHTGRVREWSFEKELKSAIDVFYKERDRWARYYRTKISDETAWKVIEKLPNASKRLRERLFARWLKERQDRGDNVWALYSALTNYASHEEVQVIRRTKVDHLYATKLNRQVQVLAWQPALDALAA